MRKTFGPPKVHLKVPNTHFSLCGMYPKLLTDTRGEVTCRFCKTEMTVRDRFNKYKTTEETDVNGLPLQY